MGEFITFNWTIQGSFYSGQINFGDGNITTLTKNDTYVIHKYEIEGRYNVTLFGRASGEKYAPTHSDWVVVDIKNKAPQFNISMPNEAYEDENISVSVVDIFESTHDYHPGVINFENDNIGEDPEGWTVSEMSECTAQVIESTGNHGKILELYDGHPNNYVLVSQSISNDGYGSIFFWMRTTDTSYQTSLQVYTGANYAIIFGITQDKFKYYDGSWHIISEAPTPQDNIWYPIRIDYESTSLGFSNLDQYFWQVSINSSEYGDFNFYTNGEPNKVEFGTQYGNGIPFYGYLDAIKYSWVPDNDVLQYTFDFGDGHQKTTNLSSIQHGWKNCGTYNVTVTMFDDQGALEQKSKAIKIQNRIPEANFSFTIDSASNDTIESYFGTYDFRDEIIGKEPKDWDIYDSDDLDLEIVSLRPNGDVQAEWLPNGEIHSSLINETGNPDGSKIFYWTTYWADNYVDIYDMQSCDLQGGSVVKITIFAYGMTQNIDAHPKSNINLGGWKEEKSWSFQLNEYSWQNITWDGLNGSQFDLNNFQIRLQGHGWVPLLKIVYIDKIYCEITYSHAENLGVKVVDDGGYHREVIQLRDNNYQEKLWLENSFFAQSGGSIELYIKSNDISSHTWALCLYDGSTIGLKIFMENQWKYVNGTTHTISECGTPVNNQWHHVRLDFCTSGTYLNLEAHRFRLIIDNISSNTYYFADITQINKIRFESGTEDQGTAYIDAIGYSWDPEYTVGDNKLCVISYPVKINVQFSANCTDSASDISSLRYYWNFDDKTSDTGQIVTKIYLSGGKYYVNLTVKDDNGATDWISKLVLVHNKYPEVLEITCSDDTAQINEGETIIFNTATHDDVTDLSRLNYYWDFECYDFNPYNFDGVSGGWINSYLYTDDLSCDSCLLVKDPDGAYGYQVVPVTVQNVDPLISIFDASILSNISFEVYRNSLSKNANFTFSLSSNENIYMTELLNFTDSQDNLVYSNEKSIKMTLSKIWKIMINTSQVLPDYSWFRCYVKLEFLDGSILIISSEKLYGGEFGSWEIDLNPYFYNSGDFTFMYPLTFSSQIFDPSVDDIFLSLTYNISMQLEINCSNTLPLSNSFELNDVNYTISIFKQGGEPAENGIIFVNITASQMVLSKSYMDNTFPVALNGDFTLNPIIDLIDLLEDQMQLSDLEILSCNVATNLVNAIIVDDDGGHDALTITFNSTNNIIFENLSPRIDAFLPENGLVGKNITFYLDISDFDQITEQEDYCISNYKSNYVPIYPLDFTFENGSVESTGNLCTINDNSMEIIPDGIGDYFATYSFENDDVGEDPEDWTISEMSGCTAEVTESVGDHKKVLKLYDSHSTNYVTAYQSIFNDGYGTIEFWMRNSDASYQTSLQIYTGANYAIIFGITQDKFGYYNGGWTFISGALTPQDNIWYHIRIDYESTAGGYHGLAQYDWKLFINDTEYGDFNFNNNGEPDKIEFGTQYGNGESYYAYIDAIGYSWDPNYNIGDNLNDNPIIDFSTKFRINSLNNDEIIKYLKLFYSYKTDASECVNMSIFNFDSQSWIIIDSKIVNTSYYNNRYTILNSQFINSNFTILIKIESKDAKLFIDQLRVEYYIAKISDNYLFDHEYVPVFSDFTIISGDTQWEGDLQSQDNDSLIFFNNIDVGNYPASYSFENDENGDDPEGWIISEMSGCMVQVIESAGDHEKILEMYDGHPNNYVVIYQSISNEGYGTIEYWMRNSDATYQNSLQIYSRTNYILIFGIMQDKFKYYDGSWHEFGPTPMDNTWYHIRLDYNSENYEYQGLVTFHWRVFINSTKYGDYSFVSNDEPDKIEFGSQYGNDVPYYAYIDAIGYSWDPNYNIGDNLNYLSDCVSVTSQLSLAGVRPEDQLENAELFYSFKTNISQTIEISLYNFVMYQWVIINTSSTTTFSNYSYSLISTDFVSRYYRILVKFEGVNSSIFKFFLDLLKIQYSWRKAKPSDNVDIPDQNHDFIIDSGEITQFGDLEESDEDYLEFNSYDSHHYPASYSFENDENGEDPEGWTISEMSGCTAQVTESVGDHNKVLELHDGHPNNYVTAYQSISNDGYGTIEYWLRNSDVTYQTSMQIYSSGNYLLIFGIMQDQFKYYDGSWHIVSAAPTPQDNIWYHIRIDYESTAGGYSNLDQYDWKLFINDTEFGDYNFGTNGEPDKVEFGSQYGNSVPFYGYIDAIGYSWDANYTVGDNKYSLISIDFTAEFSMEKLILGDTVNSISLYYSYKTNISQLIDIKLYNFTSNQWVLIDSTTYLSFTNESYAIPTSRTELINETDTIEYHDFYDSNFRLLVRVQAINLSSSFQFFLDKFLIEYKFSPYSFRSDTYGFLDVVEGDYIELESFQDLVTDYIGSYSFENEEDNTQGTDIVFIDECSDNSKFQIINNYSNHNKVLRAQSYGYYAQHNFESGITEGTIEYYWLTTANWKRMYQIVHGGPESTMIWFSCDGGNFRYYDPHHPGGWIDIMSMDNNRWYHIRFDFSCTTHKYSIFIDGVPKLINQDFIVSTNELSHFAIEPDAWSSGTYFNYFDAFGFSWLSNYTTGENIPTHYLNETVDLALEEITSHRLELFEMCNISYSIKTTITQNISIGMFNYATNNWTEITSLITDNSQFYEGTIFLNDTTYISPDFKVTIQFFGINYTVFSSFELLINKLEARYNWTNILIDFGVNSNTEPLQIDYILSSRYSNILSTNSSFNVEGTYLISGMADDGFTTSKTGYAIKITNSDPFAKIDDFSNETLEDKELQFSADMNAFGTNFTKSTFTYFWLFGDGHFSTELNPTHSYAQSGVYNISLTITDCFGNIYTDVRNITVCERTPEVLGPFTFRGYEGQAILLDVDIFDAFLDEIDMKYEWFDDSMNLLANYKNPSVMLDDGIYQYTLNVTDSSGLTSSANISIVIEDVPPVVIVSNYVASFGKVSESEGFITSGGSGPGEVELHAFAYDTLYDNKFDYYWTITKGNESFTWNDFNSGFSSSVKFRATDITLYRGQVKVVSGEKSTTSVFSLNSIIDSNGNGFDDEFEARLLATNENITAFSDADDDCYTDLYELAISNTSYLDPDTDGDGLYDALDPLTGIGEQRARTDPLDWDCDDDVLSDGIEVIGWQITSELLGEILVNSDPWDNDTDNDGLNDYNEYYIGSNPRNVDSDNDGLSDLLDPFPMKFDNDEDGLSDGIEYQIGTNMNSSDTDQDGINDGDEYFGWAFKTNPLSADSDHDFLADTAEMQNYHIAIEDRYDLDDPVSLQFETNCEKAAAAQIAFTISFGEAINEPQNDKVYGIQNIPDLTVSIYKKDDGLLLYQNNTQGERYFSQVVDIRELIENSGLNYLGEYMITVDQAGTGAILEQFEVDITGYLNPNNADFDKDGIMDGVETGLLVRGYDTIDFKDTYMYDNLTVDDNPDTYDEFSLTIPYIGRVFEADLYLKVISEGIPEGMGNITVQVIKEEINCNIDDVILIDYSSNFNNISSFIYDTSLDLQTCLNNKDITEYYGNYILKIIIDEESEIFSNFTLSYFYIYTNTYVKAENSNPEAWYTNPAKKDTDGDGWNDYYEIFTMETNPLTEDTDADGVWDCYDRDPKRDVMLKISPISASHPKQYRIKIVVKFSGDDGIDYCFITPKKKADVADGSLWAAYYDGTHGSSLDLHYYVDISDDKRILDSTNDNMQFDLEFWQVDRYVLGVRIWDRIVHEGTKNYKIGSPGDPDTLTIAEYQGADLICQAKVNVQTIGIEKANTIAIHQKNKTFNGHYQGQQKMNIIQLYITDTPSSSSPFVKGVNNIVIPTDLFTETVLNGYIQNERLDETFFYSDDEEIFKFISVDRESFSDQATEEIDFIMIRFDITTDNAEDLLDLVLTCVINDTTEEEAVLYTWCSTKINGSSAILMNLPHSVLEFIPWFCDFENSEQGSQPKDYDDWFWAPAKTLGGIIAGLIITALMLAIIIVGLIVVFVYKIIMMTVLPILAHVLWLVIRAVLLVIFFILLAIELILISLSVASVGIPLLALSGFTGMNLIMGLNLLVPYGQDTRVGFYEIQSSDTKIRLESWIEWSYWSFFNLYFPLVTEKTIHNENLIQNTKSGVITDENSEEYTDPKPEASSVDSIPILSDNNFNKTGIFTYNFYVKYFDPNFEEPDLQYGVRLHLITPNGEALDFHEMDTFNENPDYSDSKGVLYNYSIDISSYDSGLWHYFFTTKDSSTEEIVFYPKNNYFTGPNTYDCPKFLMFSTLNQSNGWIEDDFYFTVEWWDMVNYNSPTNISLCLIPATPVVGSGISNTYGIKKFLMQPTEENPNYTNPVEFNIVLNLVELGYSDSETGLFHYYFEACTITGNYSYRLYLNNDSTHFDSFLAKPADEIIAEIEAIIYGSDSSVLYPYSILRYIITISDFNGIGLSEVPIISFSNGKVTNKYNMTHYYTSSDEKIFKYYFDITGAKLIPGVIDVDFEFEEDVNIVLGDGYIDRVFNFNFFKDAIYSTISTIALLGTAQLTLFNMIAILAFGASETATSYIFGTSLGILGLTAGVAGFSLFNYFDNDNYGALLGFSLACFLLYTMLTTFISIDGGTGFKALNFIKNSFSWIFIVQTVLLSASMLLIGLFPQLDILGAVFSFISSIFSIVPSLMSVYVTGISLTLICSFGKAGKGSGLKLSTGANIFIRSFEIYKKMILTGAIVGFLLLMTKLGFGITATYDN